MKAWAIGAPAACLVAVGCIIGVIWAAERGLGGPERPEAAAEVSDAQRAAREAQEAIMTAQEALDDNRRLQREIDDLRGRFDGLDAARAAKASAMVELCTCGGCCESGGGE